MEKTREKEESLKMLFKNAIEESLNTINGDEGFVVYVLVKPENELQIPYFYVKDNQGAFYELGRLTRSYHIVTLYLFAETLSGLGIDYLELGKNILQNLERKIGSNEEDITQDIKNSLRKENSTMSETRVVIINAKKDVAVGYVIASEFFRNIDDLNM